ncbi:MAG: hypothetical protein ACMXYK_00175 [Candidatus Woesearchaeota archaeon]
MRKAILNAAQTAKNIDKLKSSVYDPKTFPLVLKEVLPSDFEQIHAYYADVRSLRKEYDVQKEADQTLVNYRLDEICDPTKSESQRDKELHDFVHGDSDSLLTDMGRKIISLTDSIHKYGQGMQKGNRVQKAAAPGVLYLAQVLRNNEDETLQQIRLFDEMDAQNRRLSQGLDDYF